jgi:hypothetical protein
MNTAGGHRLVQADIEETVVQQICVLNIVIPNSIRRYSESLAEYWAGKQHTPKIPLYIR